MYLLNTYTLTLNVFVATRPEYAILSHKWGAEQDEVTFQEMQSGDARHREKKGFDKISRFCQVAKENGYKWVWVDTCCIDKSSSAELSEAINSMYHWYKEADVCYAYLEDVDEVEAIGRSRWFTRGWTLQELLAPEVVEFYDREWNEIGTRFDLRESISKATGIEEDVLRGSLVPNRYTVALRMSWAADRESSREEDTAYSLLGLFGVHMPLLYGEGKISFQRLQEEILKVSEDYTMFAWRNRPKGKGDMGRDPTSVLARSPWDFRNDASRIEVVGWDYTQLKPIDWNPFQPKESDFNWRGCPTIINFSSRPTDFEPPRKTTRGLRVTLPFITKMSPSDELLREANLAFLYCYREPKGEMVCLVLHENDGINSSGAKGQYYRPLGGQGIHFVAPQSVTVEFRTVYIRITSREQPLRLRLKALGFEGLAAIVLLDAKGTPKLLKQKPTDKKLFLLHVKCGEVFVRVLVSMGHEKRWCCMSTTPDKTFNIKKERASKEIAALMIDDRAGFSERMSTSTILPAGKFECTLKARPHGWLELPSNADLQQGTTGLEKVYSLGLRYGSSQRERLPVEIVESMWYDKK